MKSTSLWWNENDVCRKHWLPQTPCPKCLAEQDENVEIVMEDIDYLNILYDK